MAYVLKCRSSAMSWATRKRTLGTILADFFVALFGAFYQYWRYLYPCHKNVYTLHHHTKHWKYSYTFGWFVLSCILQSWANIVYVGGISVIASFCFTNASPRYFSFFNTSLSFCVTRNQCSCVWTIEEGLN